MLDEKPSRKKQGRSTIDIVGSRTNSFSKRAAEGKLTVIKKQCKFCGHHKAFSTISKTKCCRCKRKLN